MSNLIEVKQKENYIIFTNEKDKEEKYKINSFVLDDTQNLTHTITTKDNTSYQIISDENELKKRLLGGKLSACIFLIDIESRTVTYENIMNATNSIFTKKVNFSSSVFNQNFDFSGAIFLDKVNFNSSKFIKKVNFSSSIFHEHVEFDGAKFSDIYEVDFSFSHFHKQAHFTYCKFRNNTKFIKSDFRVGTSFYESTFKGDANFREIISLNTCSFASAKIEKKLTFVGSKIYKLNLNDLNKDNKKLDDFELNLRMSDIEYIYSLDANIPKAAYRDTFLILKSQALKNNDQISALDFYKSEMSMHKKDSKDFDKLILRFEDFISDFGTTAWKPIILIVGINIIFIYFFYCMNYLEIMKVCNNNFLTYFTYSFNPTKTIKDIYGISNLGLWEALNFLKNILIVVLIYETIKSFRKFSRKL